MGRMHCTRVMIMVAFLAVVGTSFAASSGISVTTDVDSAIVVLDGLVVGKTPLRLDDLQPGLHQVRVLHPDIESWISPVVVDSVRLADGEQRELTYTFARNTFVMTDPSGAEVLVGNKVVGITPVVIQSRADSLLQVRMRGYATVPIDADEAGRGVVRIRLERATGDSDLPNVVPESEARSSLPLFLSGASSLVAGGFSVYFKVQADRVYSEYLLTGDPVKLAETRKLDSVAGIALGASEIYFALFSYLLLSQ